MDLEEFARRHSQAVEEFNRHEGRRDGDRVAASLTAGLSVLRDSLFSRMHEDVERVIGRDSMIIPVSEVKAQRAARTEIELYQITESGSAAREFSYVGSLEWYVEWLCQLRLAEPLIDQTCCKRIREYLAETADNRRLRFESAVAKVLPEANRAPLVMFQLFPLCVQIATALAFADHNRASGLRRVQTGLLPAITDCRACHGKVLENGEQCPGCGNPLWKFAWLTTAD